MVSDRGARVVVEGRALHSGERARVVLHARPGPVGLRAAGVEAPLARWHARPAERSTWVELDGGEARVRLVEHLLAALGGMALHDGVLVEVEGSELPLLDGASRAWAEALGTLRVAKGPPRLTIARAGTVDVGASRYVFAPATRADEPPRVGVRVEFDDPRVAPDASWTGDVEDFVARVAPARTFCFARELDELARKGLAAFATPDAVLVIGESILAEGRPYEADEPARHKLLDLIGDLFLYGGPPRGEVHARRPGHAATHAAMRIAIDEGIVVAPTS